MDEGDDFLASLERARDLLGATDDARALAEASAAASRALAARPQDASAWLVKCQILSAQGDDAAALACAEMAVRRTPRKAEPHYWRAAILGDLGRYRDGLDALDRAFKHLGKGDDWLVEDLYYERATMLDAMGDRAAAIAVFELGLERCPGSPILRAGLEPLVRMNVRAQLKVLRGGRA
jgi:tetratricopeptide (TPR) repeat protein